MHTICLIDKQEPSYSNRQVDRIGPGGDSRLNSSKDWCGREAAGGDVEDPGIVNSHKVVGLGGL